MKTGLLKNSFVLFLCCIFLISCTKPEEAKDSTAEINSWFDQQYEELLQMSPLQLTTQGRKDHYSEIDDLSEAGEKKRLDWMEASVAEMKEKFDEKTSDHQAQLSWRLWEYQYEQAKSEYAFRNSGYEFNQMSGSHTSLPNMLINYHKVDSLGDMEALISRYSELGRAIGQLMDRAKAQAIEGNKPPKFAYEYVIQQAEALIKGQPFSDTGKKSPLWSDALSKIQKLEDEGKITSEEAGTLRSEAKESLSNSVKPAYAALVAWLKEELPALEATPTGLSRHENGNKYYAFKLKSATTTELSADEIHEIGLKEVERIQKEMLAIKEQVGFEGDLKAFFKFINSDPQFYFPNTDEGRKAYLDESTAYLDTLTKRAPEFFGILPKAKLEVRRVEAFREQDGAPQHYAQGTPDGSRPGTYYVHLSDMTAMPKSTLEGVAYHEGTPGHHMQISIQQELQDIPKFRTQLFFNAYVEGWALYSEALAKEMGGYKNPYYDFGRLVNEVWRAIRLVTDTGLHSKGWTEADAIAYFEENSSISAGAIQSEVRRYMVMPGQATGYKIGMLKIQELRAKSEKELGEKFDLKAFHDLVLGQGALPLNILEEEVNLWIAEKSGKENKNSK
ncbi:uncharacterized protein (DUF885 family) [Algoriphagus ratkowskyi]|uniref:DUF885 domain-containing protein n=1 Tax=Algoriphagus ratkowskyi TaxID=57028 RepID=A0A2W7RHQ0_9BACT|nr:DUF885 domain-containing protein [Algoriphagus ratkowskyi]PZX60428.1 uncharacterized protein (DUF885 family) [Algoriphagus ratkowskyi]TXD78238.1 DUF885 domain-containing protein [Algoriphagus ratkowskyi]